MSTRTSSAAILLATLGACGNQPADTQVLAKVEQQQSVTAVEEGRVKCALAGAPVFQRVCTVDREQSARGLLLTVRHPDGGFHRLLVATDGRGVVSADGAEPAQVTLVDAGEIEVALGDDIYRLPATLKARE